jgi:hypothetical protein
MSNPDDIKTICECQYVGENISETKANCNNTFNIHEIDEEDSETEATVTIEQSNSPASDEEDKTALETKNTSEDESAYVGESFYSDESCDESDITNVTSRSLNSSLLRVTDLQHSQSSKNQDDVEVDELRWKDDESCQLSDEPSRASTADRLIKSRRCRRWNMSFTDEEMRRIERENELLLRKIMAQQKPRHKILGERTVQSRISSSAINRRKLQKKIDDDNLVRNF